MFNKSPFLVRRPGNMDMMVAAALILAAALRIVLFVAALLNPVSAFEPDSVGYIALGDHWKEAYIAGDAAFREMADFRLPVYPLFLACVGAWALPIQVLLSFVPILVVAPLCARAPRALSGTVLFSLAVDPLWAVLSTLFLTEILFSVTLLFAWQVRGDIKSGFAAGAALLTRTIGLPLAALLYLRRRSRWKFALALLPFFIAILLRSIALDAPLYTSQTTKYFSSEETVRVLGEESRLSRLRTTVPKVLFGGSTESILRRWNLSQSGAWRLAVRVWSFLASATLLGAALAGGIRHRNRETFWLFAAVVLILAPGFLVHGYGRFRAPAVPLLALAALAGYSKSPASTETSRSSSLQNPRREKEKVRGGRGTSAADRSDRCISMRLSSGRFAATGLRLSRGSERARENRGALIT